MNWICKNCGKEILRGHAYAKFDDYILCIPCYDKQNDKEVLEIDFNNLRPRSIFSLEQLRFEEISLSI